MPGDPTIPADLDAWIAEVRGRCDAATSEPSECGIVAPSLDAVEWFRQHLSFGIGPIWCVHHPGHPKAKGPIDKPEHAVLSAITGNGPDSENNAKFYAAARTDLPQALAIIEQLRNEILELKKGT